MGTVYDLSLIHIWADVNETISLEVPLEETVEEHSGEIRNRYWLRLFSLRIPLTWGEITGKAEVETSSRQLGIGFITCLLYTSRCV